MFFLSVSITEYYLYFFFTLFSFVQNKKKIYFTLSIIARCENVYSGAIIIYWRHLLGPTITATCKSFVFAVSFAHYVHKCNIEPTHTCTHTQANIFYSYLRLRPSQHCTMRTVTRPRARYFVSILEQSRHLLSLLHPFPSPHFFFSTLHKHIYIYN